MLPKSFCFLLEMFSNQARSLSLILGKSERLLARFKHMSKENKSMRNMSKLNSFIH